MTAPPKLKPEDVFDFDDLDAMSEEQQEQFVDSLKVLVQHAANHLKSDLYRYGNRITPEHGDALAAILRKYTLLATRIETGRWVYDLDTGMGKTTSVVAWITAVLALDLPFSILVAANHVEALCRMKEELLAKGVDPEAVGLSHSKDWDAEYADAARRGDDPKVAKKYASLPATEHNDQRQVLLATHEHLRRRKNLDEYNGYRDRDRDLVIWDESLVATESTAIAIHEITSALGWIEPLVFRDGNRHRDREQLEEAIEYIEACYKQLKDEVKAMSSAGSTPRTLEFPQRTQAQLDRYTKLVRSVFGRHRGAYHQSDALRRLLRMVGEPVRVAMSGADPVVIQTEIKVPDELGRVVILDASYPIHELERRDPRIQHDPNFYGRVKQYSNVTLHHWKRGAGRGSVEREFRERRAEDRALGREIVEVIKKVPANEAILIFTFRAEGLDLAGSLRRDLQAGGIDTAARVVDEQGTERDRIAWLTWGRETSLNTFGYCAHVIFAGVLYRSFDDLAAATLAQGRDLLAQIDGREVEVVRRSAVAHGLYQAMSRGAMRFVDGDNEARRMTVWLPLYDEKILELLETAMPGVQIVDWELVHAQVGRARSEEVADIIVAYLEGQPASVREVPIKRLKVDCGLTRVTQRVYQEARGEALERCPGWTLVRHSLRRRDF